MGCNSGRAGRHLLLDKDVAYFEYQDDGEIAYVFHHTCPDFPINTSRSNWILEREGGISQCDRCGKIWNMEYKHILHACRLKSWDPVEVFPKIYNAFYGT